MAEVIRELISEEKVDARIRELGEQISKDYAGESVHLVCILKGACIFMCDLAKRIRVPLSMDFMTVSSYGSGTQSSGIVRIKKDLDDPIKGLNVLIVEDIVDSGRTLHYLTEVFKERGCKSVRTCTLLDKPERRVVDLDVDYVGFMIPNQFVVGYGMDYDQRYRDLPFIGVVEFTEE
jgi:hypoxanthine phosphoribosyltransferase